jgi:hypothetical protein
LLPFSLSGQQLQKQLNDADSLFKKIKPALRAKIALESSKLTEGEKWASTVG